MVHPAALYAARTNCTVPIPSWRAGSVRTVNERHSLMFPVFGCGCGWTSTCVSPGYRQCNTWPRPKTVADTYGEFEMVAHCHELVKISDCGNNHAIGYLPRQAQHTRSATHAKRN